MAACQKTHLMDAVVGRLLKDQFNKSSAACAAAVLRCVGEQQRVWLYAAFADPLYPEIEPTACATL